MVEMGVVRLQELTIILYACSVLFYFIDFLQNNRKVNAVAFWLLAFVWILQSLLLLYRLFDTGRFPIFSLYEGLYFFAWVLITLSLVANRFLKIDFLVFFTNLIGFSMMSLYTFAPVQHSSSAVTDQLVSELLFIHITMAIVSYGAFAISFVFSVLYLLQYNLLKKKKWNKRTLRLDDLSKLEHMSYVLNVIGVPMLLLSLLLGIIWADIKLPSFHFFDAKVIGSFLVIVVYGFYLYRKTVTGLQGKSLATWNVGSFLLLLINYFLFGSLSRFHIWYS